MHVLATSVTATRRMLAVLADTAIAAVLAAAFLAVLLSSGRLRTRDRSSVKSQGRAEYSNTDSASRTTIQILRTTTR